MDGSTETLSRQPAPKPLSEITPPPGVELEHLQRTIGTVVHGLDLRKPIEPETAKFLRALWLERKVIFFRDQDISIEQHIALGRCFGRLDTFLGNAGSQNHREGYPELLVLNRGADPRERENYFHEDVPFTNPPTNGAVAMVRDGPEVGGDTVFADMVAAYEAMSDWLKRAVVGLRAEHRFEEISGYYNQNMVGERLARMKERFPPMVQPVVQIHPETGRKVLYVGSYAYRIMDVPKDESFALIKVLMDQARIPEHQCRFQWKKNSIAIWDNRSVQHYACFDYVGERRELHRVTIMGDQPWPEQP
jgi:taurine dioxygenase